MNPQSQRIKTALDNIASDLDTAERQLPAIQAKIDAGANGVPVAEVTALADQAEATFTRLNTTVATLVQMGGVPNPTV